MKNELIESQENLMMVMNHAVGVYMSKEPSERDNWRRVPFWNLVKHTEHELEEVIRSGEKDRQYHNLLDLIGLMRMLAWRIRYE